MGCWASRVTWPSVSDAGGAHGRQVIALAHFGGLTHAEIAAWLGYPIGTVKSRMRLGVEQPRGLLAADLAV